MDDATIGSCSFDCSSVNTAFTRTAFLRPTNPEWFVIVTGDVAHVFNWSSYGELTSTDGIRLQRPILAVEPTSPREPIHSPKVERFLLQPFKSAGIFARSSYHIGPGLVVELLKSSASARPQLYVWPATIFDPNST